MKNIVSSHHHVPVLGSFAVFSRLFREELPAHKITLIFAILCMFGVAVTTALTAYLIDPAIKKIFIEKDASLLFTLPAIIVFVSVMRGLTTFGQAHLMSSVGMYVVNNLQKKMFDKLLIADLTWIYSKHSGEIVSSFVNDAIAMRDVISNVIVGVAKESLTLIGCATVMFYQDWRLASMTLFIFLPVVLLIKKLMKQSMKSAHHVFKETGKLSAHIAETVKGMRIVRVYGREDYEMHCAEKTFALRMKYILRDVRARAASAPMTEAITGVGIAIAILYAGSEGLEGRMDVNNFMAFFASMMMAYQPGRALSGLMTKIQFGVVAAQRVYQMLDMPIAITSPSVPVALKQCQGNISFENVSFNYDGVHNVLHHINLNILAGQKIALVGPSGGGKTTLLNLIPRFYDVSEGTLKIDGLNVTSLHPADLRRHIALVSQDAFLFDGTIEDNILYGDIKASHEQMIEATKSAAAYDFIKDLPNGFKTRVGEGGTLLSGGQRQRIAIARAFLKNAPILLLDEATSALDNESEAHVQDALQKLMRGRTTIVIAHRLSTIIDANRILVIAEGKIVADGTHSQLLAQNQLYAKLYQLSEIRD